MTDFNFNWMTNYIYDGRCGAGVPEGHDHPRHARATTTRRPTRTIPIPDQWVGYGDRTVDEMAHAWMNVVYLTDAEYQQWLEKHKPTTTVERR